jgi:uncharacterized UBP type Zn finger protein
MVPLAAPRNKRQALDPVFSSRARSAQAPGPYELHRRQSAMSIPESGCSHAATIHHRGRPKTRGCEECLAMGDSWVHLRMCTECGHVGCCDSSKNRHASQHYRATKHPIIRSLEPGEAWGWCFVDELMFERLPG